MPLLRSVTLVTSISVLFMSSIYCCYSRRHRHPQQEVQGTKGNVVNVIDSTEDRKVQMVRLSTKQ